MNNYYDLCCRYQGRHVTIRERSGKVHSGRITRVTRSHVYLEPRGGRNLGGFGYGFYGGYGYRRPYAVPLAFVSGLVLGSLFFW
jgi:hypothetical protein